MGPNAGGCVLKVRGVPFRGGYHDFMIRKGGLDIFPRLVAAEHREDFPEGICRAAMRDSINCYAAAFHLARARY